MNRCPHCGNHLGEDLDPIAKLRRWLREQNLFVGPMDEVDETTAAKVLNLQPKTLANQRYLRRAPPHRLKAGRAWYKVEGLAALLED